MHRCLSAERSSHLNVETEPNINWYVMGGPSLKCLSVERSSHLNVETEPSIQLCC